jgi:translocator assembly and maintenance protein 41
LYLAGRLQNPVKILRDDPRVRLANQINLISAVRTALLLLPPSFNERELYSTIAGISYMGDLRMTLPTENPHKVANMVSHQLQISASFALPLSRTYRTSRFKIHGAANITGRMTLNQCHACTRYGPIKRGNMVRRLPKSFRQNSLPISVKFQILNSI